MLPQLLLLHHDRFIVSNILILGEQVIVNNSILLQIRQSFQPYLSLPLLLSFIRMLLIGVFIVSNFNPDSRFANPSSGLIVIIDCIQTDDCCYSLGLDTRHHHHCLRSPRRLRLASHQTRTGEVSQVRVKQVQSVNEDCCCYVVRKCVWSRIIIVTASHCG